MFGLFKKRKKEVQIKGYYAFVDGTSIDITEVPDEMFATKMLGDGIAIQPSSDEFVSPCNGKITTIMDSKHAIGIENEDFIQIPRSYLISEQIQINIFIISRIWDRDVQNPFYYMQML